MYVYIKFVDVFTVGFYDPRGQWYTESEHATTEEAAARVSYLNGGSFKNPTDF